MEAQIGRYRIERRIGAGSFASVWLGHDDDLDVPVAVKVLAENWSDNADVRARFLAEARIMRRIHDPRLVQVYDIGTLADGRPYFVMDFIDGGSLNDLRKAGLPPVRALQICAQACRAIEVLHENDIIHRDVTPGNLLVSHRPHGELRVLIADLGVAKSMIEAVGATMTAGTPSYMAPEQARGSPLDRRVDIFSLTAVTFAMLTGTPPFPVRSVGDILEREPGQQPPAIAAQLGAPPALDTVLSAGLAWDPNARPPNATVLADALDHVAGEMSGARTPTSPAPSPVSTTSLPPTPPIVPTSLPPAPSVAPPAGPFSAAPAGWSPVPTGFSSDPSGSSAVSGPAAMSGPSAASGPSAWSAASASSPTRFPPEHQAAPPADQTSVPGPRSSKAWSYLLYAVGALALFTVAMFLTIWLLR